MGDFVAPFYGWDLIASSLENQHEEAGFFVPLKRQLDIFSSFVTHLLQLSILSLCVWFVCLPYPSVFFVFPGKELVLLNLIGRYIISAS